MTSTNDGNNYKGLLEIESLNYIVAYSGNARFNFYTSNLDLFISKNFWPLSDDINHTSWNQGSVYFSSTSIHIDRQPGVYRFMDLCHSRCDQGCDIWPTASSMNCLICSTGFTHVPATNYC